MSDFFQDDLSAAVSCEEVYREEYDMSALTWFRHCPKRHRKTRAWVIGNLTAGEIDIEWLYASYVRSYRGNSRVHGYTHSLTPEQHRMHARINWREKMTDHRADRWRLWLAYRSQTALRHCLGY